MLKEFMVGNYLRNLICFLLLVNSHSYYCNSLWTAWKKTGIDSSICSVNTRQIWLMCLCQIQTSLDIGKEWKFVLQQGFLIVLWPGATLILSNWLFRLRGHKWGHTETSWRFIENGTDRQVHTCSVILFNQICHLRDTWYCFCMLDLSVTD